MGKVLDLSRTDLESSSSGPGFSIISTRVMENRNATRLPAVIPMVLGKRAASLFSYDNATRLLGGQARRRAGPSIMGPIATA